MEWTDFLSGVSGRNSDSSDLNLSPGILEISSSHSISCSMSGISSFVSSSGIS